MTTNPLDYWKNGSGPPFLGPEGLHAWAQAILDAARAQTAADIADVESATRTAIDTVIAATP